MHVLLGMAEAGRGGGPGRGTADIFRLSRSNDSDGKKCGSNDYRRMPAAGASGWVILHDWFLPILEKSIRKSKLNSMKPSPPE
jgi:hypothetical protein